MPGGCLGGTWGHRAWLPKAHVARSGKATHLAASQLGLQGGHWPPGQSLNCFCLCPNSGLAWVSSAQEPKCWGQVCCAERLPWADRP